MEFVHLIISSAGRYLYHSASNIEMNILGTFLTTDVGCEEHTSIFREWALADKEDPHSGFTYFAGGNSTQLEEDDEHFIYLCDGTLTFAEMMQSKKLKIARDQFVTLIDEWREKVCEKKPKQVIIEHENGRFSIKTSN